jgi:hypothetical protein
MSRVDDEHSRINVCQGLRRGFLGDCVNVTHNFQYAGLGFMDGSPTILVLYGKLMRANEAFAHCVHRFDDCGFVEGSNYRNHSARGNERLRRLAWRRVKSRAAFCRSQIR